MTPISGRGRRLAQKPGPWVESYRQPGRRPPPARWGRESTTTRQHPQRKDERRTGERHLASAWNVFISLHSAALWRHQTNTFSIASRSKPQTSTGSRSRCPHPRPPRRPVLGGPPGSAPYFICPTKPTWFSPSAQKERITPVVPRGENLAHPRGRARRHSPIDGSARMRATQRCFRTPRSPLEGKTHAPQKIRKSR